MLVEDIIAFLKRLKKAKRKHLAIVEIGHVFIDYPFHVTTVVLGFALLLVSYYPYNPLAFWICLG
jgi:hypothetical protein